MKLSDLLCEDEREARRAALEIQQRVLELSDDASFSPIERDGQWLVFKIKHALDTDPFIVLLKNDGRITLKQRVKLWNGITKLEVLKDVSSFAIDAIIDEYRKELNITA